MCVLCGSLANLLEAGGGISDGVDDGPLQSGHADVGIVSERAVVAVGGSPMLLVAWLIEVGLRD